MIEVRFFAQLRERLGAERAELPAETELTAAQVRERLAGEHPQWRDALGDERLLIAVNHTLVKAHHPVRDGDEVAFFPPVTGG